MSFLLKRERRSQEEYVVLVASQPGGVYYYPFELDEFDRFIEAADDIRASQSCATTLAPSRISSPAQAAALVLTGEVLKRVEVELYAGRLKMSFRLKRPQDTPHEYVVLASIALGWYLYYPFELDEFHRFMAAAKKIRAAAQSFDPNNLRQAQV